MASASGGRGVLIIVENESVPYDRRVWQQALTLHDAGYSVSVICPVDTACKARTETVAGIEIHRYPYLLQGDGLFGYLLEYGNALLWQFALTWKVLFRKGFDVIHGCNPPDDIFAIAAVFKLFGKRYIFDQHDITPELFDAKFGRPRLIRRCLLLMERLSFRIADAVLVTNESCRALAERRGRIEPNRVFIVRNGPDLGRVRSFPPNPALKHGRRYLVGYVGVMGKQEGIDSLLRSIRYIVQAKGRNDIHFSLIGGGTELEYLRSYARDLRIADYVTFVGRVTSSDVLFEILSTADVCVSPDLANELNDKATMIKIMEYMALAKPVVQFDLSEGRYSAQDASLYARPNDEKDFADKILMLLADPKLRQRMGEFGRQRVIETLSWPHQAPNLLAAYNAALGQRDQGQRAIASE